MGMFRKRTTPEELGARMYEALRRGMTGDDGLGLDRLVGSLEHESEALDEQYPGELMIASMFAATRAVDRSTQRWVADRIVRGMTLEFFRHLVEQGASEEQVTEWRGILNARFADYRDCMIAFEGFEPPWKLGRLALWFLTGTESHSAVAVRDTTLFLEGAERVAQDLINDLGPSLLLDPLGLEEQT